MLRTLASSETKPKIVLLFVILFLGILANWFWVAGWEYLRNPDAGFVVGPPLAILIRAGLSIIAAALTFIPTYNRIGQPTGESWVPYFLAFQNGFFWEAALGAVAKEFGG